MCPPLQRQATCPQRIVIGHMLKHRLLWESSLSSHMAESTHASSCASRHHFYRASDRYAANPSANDVVGICCGEIEHNRTTCRAKCTCKKELCKRCSSAGISFLARHGNSRMVDCRFFCSAESTLSRKCCAQSAEHGSAAAIPCEKRQSLHMHTDSRRSKETILHQTSKNLSRDLLSVLCFP